MSVPRCGCGQPAPDAVICRACTKTLGHALVTAILLADDLELAAARQSRFAEPGRRSANSVLPFDERASDAAHALRAELSGWVRVLNERRS